MKAFDTSKNGPTIRRSTPPGEHRPVMLAEVLKLLDPKPGEITVDCTLGNAGHATAILERIGPSGRLIGIDWDADNLSHARERLAATGFPFSIHQSNFAGLPKILAAEQLAGVDIVIADLGMSSMQVDDPERGFSYVRDGPLDMRMNRARGRTAAELLATISTDELAESLREFGDEPEADRIAQALVTAREQAPLARTSDVTRVIGELLSQPVTRDAGWRLRPQPNQWRIHPAARTFQALRMLVNRELANLQELLRVLPQCLGPGGRAAIIGFHSGEDRLVKEAFREGLGRGVFGKACDEPTRASEAEKLTNPRARSAKLRWARRFE